MGNICYNQFKGNAQKYIRIVRGVINYGIQKKVYVNGICYGSNSVGASYDSADFKGS